MCSDKFDALDQFDKLTAGKFDRLTINKLRTSKLNTGKLCMACRPVLSCGVDDVEDVEVLEGLGISRGIVLFWQTDPLESLEGVEGIGFDRFGKLTTRTSSPGENGGEGLNAGDAETVEGIDAAADGLASIATQGVSIEQKNALNPQVPWIMLSALRNAREFCVFLPEDQVDRLEKKG